MSRRPTTGRFKTREELVERILFLYHSNNQKVSQIASSCGISGPTVSSILEKNPAPKEPKPNLAGLTSEGITPQEKEDPKSIVGLWVWCFQENTEAGDAPFQGQVKRNLGSRLELKVGRKLVQANRGACSSYPFKSRK